MVGGGTPAKRAKMKGFGPENAITRLSRIRNKKTVRANLYNKALRFFLDGSRKLVTKSSAKSNADFRGPFFVEIIKGPAFVEIIEIGGG